MSRFAVTLALVLLVVACGGLLPQPVHDASPAGAMAHMGYDLGDVQFSGPGGTCVPDKWVTGTIVPISGGAAALRDDQGDITFLTWNAHNPAVVDWNRRYTIGGTEFTGANTLWACGGPDSVIPR